MARSTTSMDSKELKVQIALGTLTTDPAVAAAVVKATTDIGVLRWGIDHPRWEVRVAAGLNKSLPIIDLLYLLAVESAQTVRDKLQGVQQSRRSEIVQEIKKLRKPQLELDLFMSERAAERAKESTENNKQSSSNE